MSEKDLNKNVPESIDHMANDEDDVVTLVSAEGEEVDFVEVAGIAYQNNFYAILQPVELLELELDDAIIDAVFAEYNRLLDEADGAAE